jgi:hypothetical protein
MIGPTLTGLRGTKITGSISYTLIRFRQKRMEIVEKYKGRRKDSLKREVVQKEYLSL